MTEHVAAHADPGQPDTDPAATPVRVHPGLLWARAVGLAVVVALPPTINAQNIIGWAENPAGLGMSPGWAVVAFGGLDVIALVCVIEVIIQTGLGRKAGWFALLVWVFASASAYAGYEHGQLPGAGKDVEWFFPLMAFAGPLLLHLVIKRIRLDKELDAGRRITHAPASAYGWSRWIPGVGAFAETFCAWRVGRLEGIVQPDVAVARYRQLLPDAGPSGWKVLAALRTDAKRVRAAAVEADRHAEELAGAVEAAIAQTRVEETRRHTEAATRMIAKVDEMAAQIAALEDSLRDATSQLAVERQTAAATLAAERSAAREALEAVKSSSREALDRLRRELGEARREPAPGVAPVAPVPAPQAAPVPAPEPAPRQRDRAPRRRLDEWVELAKIRIPEWQLETPAPAVIKSALDLRSDGTAGNIRDRLEADRLALPEKTPDGHQRPAGPS